MIRRITSILMFLMASQFAVCQPETKLDQLNEAGKKQGYWTCYLNKDFLECAQDSAHYKYYSYFQNGKKIMGKIHKWIDKCVLLDRHDEDSEEILLLNGTYQFKREDKEGWTYTLKFKEGFPQYDRIDHDASGENFSEIFYETKFNGIEASYYAVSKSKGALFKGYYYLENGNMRNNLEKMSVKKSSGKRFKK